MVTSLTPHRSKDQRCRHGSCSAVVALPEAGQAEEARRLLRRLGWAVRPAASADEVREHLMKAPGSIVILSAQLADESGWLTCAKLTVHGGRTTVVIVGPDTPRNRLLARLTGAAALVADPTGLSEWLG